MHAVDSDLRLIATALIEVLRQDNARAALLRLLAAGDADASLEEMAQRVHRDAAGGIELALGMLMQGRTLAAIARQLGVRRQSLYESPEFAIVRQVHAMRRDARRQAREDRRALLNVGQIPDTPGNRGDA
jgi:DNA-binding phage protein